jgi:uncharacterized RDD family membrane protein YckC
MLSAAGDGPRSEVRRRADVADDASSRKRLQKHGILHGPDAVSDPYRLKKVHGVGDRIRPPPFACMHDRKESGFAAPAVHLSEIARGKGRLLSAETESHDARPGPLGVEIEDALGGRRAPVPHEVEQNAHAPATPRFVLREGVLESALDVEPVEPDLLHDRRRDIDLRPAHVFPGEARHEATRDEGVIGGAPNLAADIAVEAEKRVPRTERTAPRANGCDIGEDGPYRAGREADEDGRRNRSFEVQVKLHFRRRGEAAEKGEGVSSRGHVSVSYESPFETGPVRLGTPPRARLWMRIAAFGVDLLLVAGGPLLLASVIVLGVHMASREVPAGLDAGFRAAQAVAVGLFLLRDAGGGSPGKKLFGLRLIREGGAKAGVLQSLLRNATLLVPGWNLIEFTSVMRRRDGRRPGDRVAGTALVEA